LFQPGQDFLMARNRTEMRDHLRALCADPELRTEIAAHGLNTVRARHTCAHRVDELLGICARLAARSDLETA
jgi:spore maturation protein CgeB